MESEHMSIQQIWTKAEKILKANNEPYKHLTAVYELHLDDDDVYQLHFAKGDLKFYEKVVTEADCTLKMSEKNFKKFLAGKLNSAMAFMSGQLKVEGNISLALSLEKIIKQYDSFLDS